MRIYLRILWLCTVVLFAGSCNKQVPDAVEELPAISIDKFGEDNTLEIASWNIEMFPMHGETIPDVKRIILDLDIDLYAVQEINNSVAFDILLDSLNAGLNNQNRYDGRINLESNNLKTGIIFKKSMIEVVDSTYLFEGDNDFAGRPPFALYLRAHKNNQVFDFTIIVLHLKAFDEGEDRRRESVRKLHDYVESQRQSGGDPDYVLAGDWNDLLDDGLQNNIFLPFLEDSLDYRFLTRPFAGSNTEYSYIAGSFQSLIDHIMITTSIDSAAPGIHTQILKLDQDFPPSTYLNEVSDHRPVGAKFPVF